jgi:hypothetical protein
MADGRACPASGLRAKEGLSDGRVQIKRLASAWSTINIRAAAALHLSQAAARGVYRVQGILAGSVNSQPSPHQHHGGGVLLRVRLRQPRP